MKSCPTRTATFREEFDIVKILPLDQAVETLLKQYA
jgi:hypothetical protein